jgi:transposase
MKRQKRKLELLFKEELPELLESLKSNYEVDLAIKVLALINYAYNNELSTNQIAYFLRVNESSISRWIKAWNEEQFEGLKNKTLLKKKERDLLKYCKEKMKELKESDSD